MVVDEAQDLEPSVLRILVKLCKAPNRFFITADANQSIYRAGFTWKDVDASLNFQGRTTVLKTNYRSTREIGEAAHSYLTSGAEDSEAADPWIHSARGPKPAVRWTQSEEEEWQLLGTFVSNAVRDMSLGLGTCAILCPSKRTGEAIARTLNEQGRAARFFASNQVDLASPEVKVLTLHASKGLEFPTVALCGFRGSRYDRGYDDLSEEERTEVVIKARRLLFVGMTRAMQTLLVLLPCDSSSPVLTGFDAVYWDGGQRSCKQ